MTRKADFISAEEVFAIESDTETSKLTNVQQAADEFLRGCMGQDAEGEGNIIIKRQNGTGKSSMTHIENVPLDKYSYDDLVERIRINHGGGDYRFYIYQIDEDGKKNLIGNKLVSIGEVKTNDIDNKSDTAQILQQQSELIREIFESSNKPQNAINFDDMLTKATAIAAVASPFLLAWMANRPKAIDPFDQLSKIMVLQGKIEAPEKSESEDDGGIMGMAGKFLEAMTAMKQAPALPQAGAIPSAAPVSAAPIAAVSSSDAVYAPYAAYFDMLLVAALNKPDAQQLALEFSGRIEGDVRVMFLKLVKSPDALAFILRYNADFINHADWLSAFLAELDDYLSDEENSAVVDNLHTVAKPDINSENSEGGPINASTTETGQSATDSTISE